MSCGHLFYHHKIFKNVIKILNTIPIVTCNTRNRLMLSQNFVVRLKSVKMFFMSRSLLISDACNDQDLMHVRTTCVEGLSLVCQSTVTSEEVCRLDRKLSAGHDWSCGGMDSNGDHL